MKIFISYSTADIELVRHVAAFARAHAEVFYWEESKIPGKEDWPTIFSWIDQSDLVLAVITDETVRRAMAVGQEIGQAKAKGKAIIPLVGPFVDAKELGFLSRVTYQRIHPDNPGPALKTVEKVILARKQSLETWRAISVIGGILALVLLSSEG